MDNLVHTQEWLKLAQMDLYLEEHDMYQALKAAKVIRDFIGYHSKHIIYKLLFIL